MTHREDKKKAKRGNDQNTDAALVKNVDEMKKQSTKGLIKGERH
ncbi:MAG: hypothetical protein Q8936_01470 [Bacillota bacterium]|nr:hypothetical protein [Bacillota bacterium]